MDALHEQLETIAELQEAREMIENLRKEVNRLNDEALKASVRYEKIRIQLSTSNMHLFKMLDEMEGRFENTTEFDSPEICRDYMDAAMYCQRYHGRSAKHMIDKAQDWYNNYSLPFKS